MAKDYTLVGAILTDHEERILSVPKGYFKPREVVLQISLMQIDTSDKDRRWDPAAIVEKLPRLGYGFVTLRGTYTPLLGRKLIKNTQKALRIAMRRCPDREYLPLALSVLEHDHVPGSLTGLVFDFLGDWLSYCELNADGYALKDADSKLESKFSKTVRTTIQSHWDYVASLGDF